jgi:glutamyl endopeptidase
MTDTTPAPTALDALYTPVSNVPPEAAAAVITRQVTLPSTAGYGPQASAPNAQGLEAIAAQRPAAFTGGPESVGAAVADRWVPPESSELRDIGVASFGEPPPAPETVHGPDDRTRIPNTAEYPWRAIASLLITARDNSAWVGTAWFVSPRTLVTAGHCVYIKNSQVPGRDGWVSRIDVMAGRDGMVLPFGSVTSTSFHSVTGWTENGDENYDLGVIVLPVPLGDTVGVFGIGSYPDAELANLPVNVSGYPGDKVNAETGTQWFDGQEVAHLNGRKVFYDIDTVGGQSGAPVFRIEDGNRIGIAIHAYGGHTTNSGTRINDAVYNLIKAWMA